MDHHRAQPAAPDALQPDDDGSSLDPVGGEHRGRGGNPPRGLGGRDVTQASIASVIERAAGDAPPEDLLWEGLKI